MSGRKLTDRQKMQKALYADAVSSEETILRFFKETPEREPDGSFILAVCHRAFDYGVRSERARAKAVAERLAQKGGE